MIQGEELQVALTAVRQACLACRHVQSQLAAGDAISKADASPVTTADFASQAIVNHHLRAAFPEHAVLAEERSAELRDSRNAAVLERVVAEIRRLLPELHRDEVLATIDHGRTAQSSVATWVLDPIDGTKGFLRGEQYAVALALLVDGVPRLGVLGCPNLPPTASAAPAPPGVLLYAVTGEGAWQLSLAGGAPVQVRVNGIALPSEATWCESVESAHSAHGSSARIAARLGVASPPLRMDSQCKYALVARGQASYYLRVPTRAGYREKVWDHAAGAIIVQQAGGRVSDALGAPLDFSTGSQLARNTGVIASNELLHDALVAAVAESPSSDLAGD